MKIQEILKKQLLHPKAKKKYQTNWDKHYKNGTL